MATPVSAGTANPPYPQSPVLEKMMALVCLLINIFVPGIGTIVAGVLGKKPMIGRGLAQLVLSLILVGWIWGIITGVQLLQNAMWQEGKVSTATV